MMVWYLISEPPLSMECLILSRDCCISQLQPAIYLYCISRLLRCHFFADYILIAMISRLRRLQASRHTPAPRQPRRTACTGALSYAFRFSPRCFDTGHWRHEYFADASRPFLQIESFHADISLRYATPISQTLFIFSHITMISLID